MTFIGIFNIPQDNGCKGDSLCLWLGEKVGRDATIEIMGAISDDSFKFGAKFSGTIVLIENKLTLQEIELSLELSGKKSSVKLSCTLYWADRDILGEDQLQFQGKDFTLIPLGNVVQLCSRGSVMWRMFSITNFKDQLRF